MQLSATDIKLPRGWVILAGADTGTYMGGIIAALSPSYHLWVLEEFPNYHYTGDGTIELIGMTVGEWVKGFGTSMRRWSGQSRNRAWVDANTTFKTEIGHGFGFRMNHRHLELRTEVTREYLRNGRIHVPPWCPVLLYEMEEAHYPEHESAGTGRLCRVKIKDHCLDGLEHICSRRPHPDFKPDQKQKASQFAGILSQNMQLTPDPHDPHLGAL